MGWSLAGRWRSSAPAGSARPSAPPARGSPVCSCFHSSPLPGSGSVTLNQRSLAEGISSSSNICSSAIFHPSASLPLALKRQRQQQGPRSSSTSQPGYKPPARPPARYCGTAPPPLPPHFLHPPPPTSRRRHKLVLSRVFLPFPSLFPGPRDFHPQHTHFGMASGNCSLSLACCPPKAHASREPPKRLGRRVIIKERGKRRRFKPKFLDSPGDGATG